MIQDSLVIGIDAYKSANRRKGTIFLLLLIAILQVAVFALYKDISLGIEDKLLKDVGLGMILIVGAISGLTAAFQIPTELRERTAMTLFAKPLGREAYMLGKLIGVAVNALKNMFIVGVGVYIVFNFKGTILSQEFTIGFLQSFLLVFISVIDLIALTLILCLFMSEGVVVLTTLCVFVLGNAVFMLSYSSTGISAIAGVLKYILPNFYLFDIKNEAAANLSISSQYIAFTSLYGIAYAVVALSIALLVFNKKDL